MIAAHRPPRQRLPFRRVIVAAATVLVLAGAKAPAPLVLGIEVHGAETAAPAQVREALEAELHDELTRRACVQDVRPAGTAVPADVVLRVAVLELEEELRHETSLAQSHSPQRVPEVDQLVLAHAETRVALELRAGDAPSRLLRERTFAVQIDYRPVAREDARTEARAKLLAEAARRAASFACDIASPRLQRELAQP